MRRLKLQMQITVDGFVAGPQGQLDWMTWEMDEKLIAFISHLTDTSDTILMGRKMTEGFVNYWEGIKPESPEFSFAKKMVDLPKIVFSRTVKSLPGRNVRVETRDLGESVNQLKKQPGKDLIVYGGATLVSSLIKSQLIDELNLFVNPIAISNGLRIFEDRVPLKLTSSTAYKSGIVVNTYAKRDR